MNLEFYAQHKLNTWLNLTDLRPFVMDRVEARRAHSKTYYTGKKCIHDHLSYRYTSNARCIECGIVESLKLLLPHPVVIARENAAKFYKNLSPCIKCGTNKRYTAGSNCVMCVYIRGTKR